MTAQIKQIVTAGTDILEVARQDYELAKREVDDMLLRGYHRTPRYHERFQAAVQRRAQARERWIKALTA